MAKTLVKNVTVDSAITLPEPYNRILGPGRQVVIGDLAATVRANLGGSAVFASLLDVSEAAASATVDIVAAGGGLPQAGVFLLSDIAAKSTNGVHAALAANAANVFPGPFTNPAYPRNLRVVLAASYDGGDVTVVGTDQFDVAQTETFTGTQGTTQVGTKVFKTVVSATKATVGATANTVSIGTGDKLAIFPSAVTGAPVGSPVSIANAVGILLLAGVSEAVTLDATAMSFVPTTVPNGTVDYTLLVNT